MQIIIMHSRFTQAKSITLETRHLFLAGLMVLFLSMISGALMAVFTIKFANGSLPIAGASLDDGEDKLSAQERYVKQNLAAMAAKLGEIQAHIVRLDALGERVQGLAGVKPEEFNFKEAPGKGGPEILKAPSTDLSLSEFQKHLDEIAKDVELRSDYLNVVENTLIGFKLQSKLLPTTQPVNVGYNASGFGWRVDPITGRSAFHEGIDFSAPTGTPIVAAAGGVVIASEYHPEFGNMVEIDHGGEMITRYAHASRIHVKIGDIVKRGQHIANIGSTGRSTGAHLHFEVRVKDVPQNPHKFLTAGNNPERLYSLSNKK